jgi:UDP-glucose 4-epimerase
MPRGNTGFLVTGGGGSVGSHLTHQLLADGEVAVVDNLAVGEAEHVPGETDLHETDLRNRDAVTDVLESVEPDVIVHLAAHHYIPYCNEHPEEAFDVNVMGTRHLLEAAESLSSLDRVVYASTAAVYPPREEPHSETDPTGPMDIYGRTKLVGEDLLDRFVTRTDVPGVAARLFNIYGPNETNPHLVPAILDQLEDGSRTVDLGNLTPKRDYIWADDVADALTTLATSHDDGYAAYNVGTGTAWSVREVVEQVEHALGEDITIEQDEDRVRESDRPHLRADPTRLEEDYGWTATTSFVDGLGDLLDARGIT